METKDVPEKFYNCWKKIGVYSPQSPSCPELEKVIHCRNCHVYTSSGRKLLEREISPAHLDEWTQIIAKAKEDETPGTISVVIFRICREWLALRTRLFAEVIDPEKYHSIPHNRNLFILGIVNVHGEIQICFSLKDLLNIEQLPDNQEKSGYRRMIVLDNKGEKWVTPVDEVHGIYKVHPDQFQNVPVTVSKAKFTFTGSIFTWKNRHVGFLDDERLLLTLTRSLK